MSIKRQSSFLSGVSNLAGLFDEDLAKHTGPWVSAWMVPFGVGRGSCGAAKRRFPRGGAAYRIPSHCVTPLGSATPLYDEYPRCTQDSTAATPVAWYEAANANAVERVTFMVDECEWKMSDSQTRVRVEGSDQIGNELC